MNRREDLTSKQIHLLTSGIREILGNETYTIKELLEMVSIGHEIYKHKKFLFKGKGENKNGTIQPGINTKVQGETGAQT